MLYDKNKKLKNEPLFTPQDFLALQNTKLSLPETIILLPFSKNSDIKQISKKHFKLFYDIDILGEKLAVAYNFGMGGPITVFFAEILAACGVKNFILAGIAGGLSQTLKIDDIVLCSGALCDDGTSKDYFEGEIAPASEKLQKQLSALNPKETGLSWTTDSIFRETAEEAKYYSGKGIKTVEMEAAPLFAFCARKHLNAAAVFVISDIVSAQGWKPHKVAQKTNLALNEAFKKITEIFLISREL